MAKKFWDWTRDKETGARELTIAGAISSDDFLSWLFDDVTPKKFRKELNSDEGDIILRINSEGGDCFAASEIYNMLKEYSDTRGLVTVRIDAIAASAASMIAMAGDWIEISPVGMIAIHNPWTITEGDAEEFKIAASQLESVKENIINAYELRTKLPRAKLARMMDEETFIHARKAVDLGFADKIIGEDNPPEEDSTTAETSDGISSRRQVTTGIMNAIRAQYRTAAPANRADAVTRYARLNRKIH